MRTVIVLILALTLPASAYMAGCRQDRSAAAFPKSTEIDKIAKAPQADLSKPPVIPAAPIDKGILNLPEQPRQATMARINAVEDNSRRIAGAQPPAGLFTLPEADDRLAQAAPAAIAPIPSAREFWSKPAASGRPVQPVEVPAGVSAMMPAAQPQPVLPPPSAPGLAAPAYMPPPGARLLPPEAVPGVFDASATSFRAGSPPARMTTARFAAPGGDALGAPLPASRVSPGRVPGRAPDQPQQGPLKLDLGGLVGPGRHAEPTAARFPATAEPLPIVQSIPGAPVYEPLPEPIPLEQYNQMVEYEQRLRAGAPLEARPVESIDTIAAVPPAPVASVPPPPTVDAVPASLPAPLPQPGPTETARKSAIPFLPIPDFGKPTAKAEPVPAPTPLDPPAAVTNPRLATLLDSNAVREALAPLPDLSAAPTAPAKKAEPVALPTPMPDPLPSPELTAAKTALLDPVTPADEPSRATMDVSARDLFRMDFWDQKPAAPAKLEDDPVPAPPSAPVATPEKPAPPQKVRLTPIRGKQRAEELGKIDAATAAPPIRF